MRSPQYNELEENIKLSSACSVPEERKPSLKAHILRQKDELKELSREIYITTFKNKVSYFISGITDNGEILETTPKIYYTLVDGLWKIHDDRLGREFLLSDNPELGYAELDRLAANKLITVLGYRFVSCTWQTDTRVLVHWSARVDTTYRPQDFI